MFGRVAGRVKHLQRHRAEFKGFAFFGLMQLEAVIFAHAADDLRAGLTFQFARSRHEIGVDVRLENVRDAAVVLARDVDVNRNIAARVNHGANALVVIAHDIRKMRHVLWFLQFPVT